MVGTNETGTVNMIVIVMKDKHAPLWGPCHNSNIILTYNCCQHCL